MEWTPAADAYDRVASLYETRFLDELARKPRDRELLDDLAIAASDPVVDIGCGPGQIGVYLRDRGRRVVGIDLSRRMAQLATARLDGALTADMRTLPLADSSAGAVIAFYSVIQLPRQDLGTAVQEFARVLRPGGRLLMSAHEGTGEVRTTEFLGEAVSLSGTFFALHELIDATATAGLDIVTAERRPPYPAEGSTTRLYVAARQAQSVP